MDHFNIATMKQYLSSVYFCDTFSVKPYATSRYVLVLYVYEVLHSTCHPCESVLCKKKKKKKNSWNREYFTAILNEVHSMQCRNTRTTVKHTESFLKS